MSEGSNPKVPQQGPYLQTVQPGKYWWCACGKALTQPFCDGAHKGGEIKPIKVEFTEETEVAWCGCKRSGTPPFCDGSHGKFLSVPFINH